VCIIIVINFFGVVNDVAKPHHGSHCYHWDTTDSLIHHWHRAYFYEIRGQFDSAISSYQNVLRLSSTVPVNLQQWYQGACNFAIARMYSMTGDYSQTLSALDSALEHHFWNFSAIRNVPTFSILLGQKWVDSVCNVWNDVRDRLAPTWASQPIILIAPKHLDTNKKYPVLIALHGGNGSYELFARRMEREHMADVLGAFVAVVPGVLRTSEVANCWDTVGGLSEGRVREAIDVVAQNKNIDTDNVTLLGFSQGSQVAYSYSTKHPEDVHSVVAFAGFALNVLDDNNIDAELTNVAKHNVKIIAVSGANDSPVFLQSTRELQQRAISKGVQFDFRIDPTLPHGMPRRLAKYMKNIWQELHGHSLGAY
jgi:predicted esterase